MMKDLKLWQKAGLVAAIVGGLTLGGLTPKYNSKGLEGKLPSIGMSTAEAKTTEPDGYEVPNLTGLQSYEKGYIQGTNVYVEKFYTPDGGWAATLSINGKIFAYDVDADRTPPHDYYLVDEDGDGKFETKYPRGEKFNTPNWVKS